MKELKLLKPPFRSFDIKVSARGMKTLAVDMGFSDNGAPVMHRGMTVQAEFDTDYNEFGFDLVPDGMRPGYSAMSFVKTRKPEEQAGFKQTFSAICRDIIKVLIVVLSIRNVEKTVKANKLAKLGIGKNPYAHTTTLSIGKITERVTGRLSPATGGEVRPHLRRGHKRMQHHGPGNSLVKEIRIEPTIVHADRGWISERTAYKVRKAA
jgi:hypothetical protein